MINKKLWLCGQYKKGNYPNVIWEFQGIFNTKKKAINACKNKNYFIFPIILNKECNEETEIMDETYYPIT